MTIYNTNVNQYYGTCIFAIEDSFIISTILTSGYFLTLRFFDCDIGTIYRYCGIENSNTITIQSLSGKQM